MFDRLLNRDDHPHILYAKVIIIVSLVTAGAWLYHDQQQLELAKQAQQQQTEQEQAKIDLERQTQEQQVQEKQAVADKAATNENNRTICLATAQTDYEAHWASACKANAERIQSGYQSCVQSESTETCKVIWGKVDGSSTCLLPDKTASGLNSNLKEQKDECFKLYPVQ